MGVKGLWKRERSLSDIALEHGFVIRPGDRTYKLGANASIWLSQVRNTFLIRHACYRRSPELRTLLFCLMCLLSAAVAVVFVFNGPHRPAIKRGSKVNHCSDWLKQDFCNMVTLFGFDTHTATGEAEAELAQMAQLGLIDAVVTDDSDIFVFNATAVIRNNSLFGQAKTVDFYTDHDLAHIEPNGLSRARFVLIALLCGGDYDPIGLPGCGITTAHGLAGYYLGEELCSAVFRLHGADLTTFLEAWCARLRLYLLEDPKGFVGRRNAALAGSVPDDFPDLVTVNYYLNPTVSDLSTIEQVAKF
ncbi:PIN domain-like protein [Cytidiella melzeri]|nr:PIN domain-like protein [Cytidiella melzeri]